MLITHVFVKCLHCETWIELLDDNQYVYSVGHGEVYCDCGYTNEINDIRLEIVEREY